MENRDEKSKIDTICNLCKLSFWEWDILKNNFQISGYFGSYQGPLNVFFDFISASDRVSIEKHLIKMTKDKTVQEKMFRIQQKPGLLKWVLMRGGIHSTDQNKLAGIIIGITQWKQSNDNQHLQQLKLIEQSQRNTRNEVISTLAHELTQPLMVINTYLSGCIYRIQENKIDKEQLIEIMNILKQHSTIMGSKIHELKGLLDASSLEYREANIHDIIQESTLLLSYELQAKNITINLEFQDKIPYVKMSKNQIKQVFYHLIKNSIENMQTDFNHISITTKKIGDCSIKVTIKDNNVENTNLISHNSSLSSTHANYEPSKIELAMCRTIIEAHGGTLSCKSSTNGNYYQFTLHS